jgi:hypothetical protein
LRWLRRAGTIEIGGRPEATELILGCLFDIRAEVHEIHVAFFGRDDDGAEGAEEEDA